MGNFDGNGEVEIPSRRRRVILDGAACRLSELGDVRDVLSVLVV